MTSAFALMIAAAIVTEAAHRRQTAGRPVVPLVTDHALRLFVGGAVLFLLSFLS